MTGTHGRIDDIGTLTKFTNTWWGRVSELVFAAYRPRAKDLNVSNGNRSPYDFDDPDYEKVDVRGAQERMTPQGRLAWQFLTVGLQASCSHVFLVGYGSKGTEIKHLWLVPVGALGESSVRMTPGSREYQGDKWDVSPTWGLVVGNEALKKYREMPEPVRPGDRFAWMDDPTYLTGNAPGKRGRRGEILYRALHPDSKDMNRANGSGSPYDFLDADGTRVNVKTSWFNPKPGQPKVFRWSFGLGQSTSEDPDVYSCLCLGVDERVKYEFRIPPAAWKGRTIHIYGDGGQWKSWLLE
jgi:hypothetical protein